MGRPLPIEGKKNGRNEVSGWERRASKSLITDYLQSRYDDGME